MAARPHILLVLVALLALGCAGGALWGVAPTLPAYHAAARAHWDTLRPPHYRMEVRWRSGGWAARALLEVRDERLVGGTNLFTSQPLDALELGVLGDMFPASRTFDQIDILLRWPPTWRGVAARLLPPLKAQIEPCLPAAPRITYDAQWGFPAELHAFPNPCYNGVGYDVTVTSFAPLP